MKNENELLFTLKNILDSPTPSNNREVQIWMDTVRSECKIGLSEYDKSVKKERSVFNVLVDYDNHRIGINKAARMIDEIYKKQIQCMSCECNINNNEEIVLCGDCGR